MQHYLTVIPITFSLSFLFSNVSALAQSVFASEAQGANGSTLKLDVSPGHGLNINFIPTGEIIRKAWIDDPSQIALSFDGDLCQWSGTQEQQCTNTGASVIHLRQIKPINFPHLPRSANGSTLLSVITEGVKGPKLYQFQIHPTSASSKPQYTALNIKPDSEAPTLVANQALNSTTDNVLAGSEEGKIFENPNANSFSQTKVETPASTSVELNTDDEVQSFTISALLETAHLLKEQLFNFYTKDFYSLESFFDDSLSTYYLQNDNKGDFLSEQTEDNNPQIVSSTVPAINIPVLTNLFSDESSQHNYSQQVINNVNAAPSLVLGLLVARQTGEIKPNTMEWLKAQTAHSWLRRGTTIEEAAIRAEMSPATLHQLIEWGQTSL